MAQRELNYLDFLQTITLICYSILLRSLEELKVAGMQKTLVICMYSREREKLSEVSGVNVMSFKLSGACLNAPPKQMWNHSILCLRSQNEMSVILKNIFRPWGSNIQSLQIWLQLLNSKSPTYEPLSCKLSKTHMCICISIHIKLACSVWHSLLHECILYK